MSRAQLQNLAIEFMVREYGKPTDMDSDARDLWHERLGLLSSFICEVAP